MPENLAVASIHPRLATSVGIISRIPLFASKLGLLTLDCQGVNVCLASSGWCVCETLCEPGRGASFPVTEWFPFPHFSRLEASMKRIPVMPLLCISATLCCIGCSDKAKNRPETIPVTVKVTLDGAPLGGGQCRLRFDRPKQAGGSGQDRCLGHCQVDDLRARRRGDRREVQGHCDQGSKLPPAPTELNEKGPARPDLAPKPKFLAPQKYSQAKTTDLTAEVSKDKKDFTFDLRK